MLTDAQLEWRRKGIGSSDIGVLAGHSLFRNATPFSVWSSKIFGEDGWTTNAMMIGNAFERPIADLYLEKLGDAEMRAHKARCRVHGVHDWVRVTPDFYIRRFAGRKSSPILRLLECKYVGPGQEYHYNTEDERGVPSMVYDQVQWQMLGTGIRVADVAALLAARREVFIWRFAYNKEYVDRLFTLAQDFWLNHVIAVEPPPIDDSIAANEYLARQHPAEGNHIELAPATAELPARFDGTYRTFLADAEKQRGEARNQLKALIGDSQGIRGPWGEATWKTQRGDVSWKHVAMAFRDKLLNLGVYPDNLQKVIEEHRGPARRVLRVKLKD